MTVAFPIELIKQLSAEKELEPIFYKNSELHFYCEGGLFIQIKKSGKIDKHSYKNYFSPEDKQQKEEFLKATDFEDIIRIYTPTSDVFAASKRAMLNRANDPNLDDSKKYLERMYQQTIAYNNRPNPGIDNACGVASYSFGIESNYLWGHEGEKETWKKYYNKKNKDTKPSNTTIDLVWVDEENKLIAFIEYKMNTNAMYGESGVTEHCAKTLLTMDESKIKEDVLRRYYAKQAFHNGNFTCIPSDFKKKAKEAAENYKSICCLMFSTVKETEMIKALDELRENNGKIIWDTMMMINRSKLSQIETEDRMDDLLKRIYYIYEEDYNHIVLSNKNFISLV